MLLEFFILNKLQIAAAPLPALPVDSPPTTLRVQPLVVPCITFFAAMFSLSLSLSRWLFLLSESSFLAAATSAQIFHYFCE